MSVKVYKKGANIFIERSEKTKRIPSAYTSYDIVQENIIIQNLINDELHKFSKSDLTDKDGTFIDKPDDYLSGIIGSFN